MKLYLAGPIYGQEDSFEAEFGRDLERLLFAGYLVVSPVNILACPDLSCWERGTRLTTWKQNTCPGGIGEHTYECYIRYDLMEMFKCDAVAYRDGWEDSFGSRNEISQAGICGMQVHSVRWWLIQREIQTNG